MSFNQSEEVGVNVTLDQLNSEVVATKYGAIIILGILIPLGVIGNGHVLHFYIFKKKNTNTRVFVCCLAVIDFVASSICFPWVISFNFNPLESYSDAFCKILYILNYFLAVGEVLMLLVIAVERYRKICEPFKPQITLKQAKASHRTRKMQKLSLNWSNENLPANPKAQ
ncbi:neuropeptide FF receptor 2-like [Dreissena polymorpha]|uniref:neuropeptide FF receptor 2-like n=1 Tax=Dreissena polymorpha TaxID=45954 RepID=UPI002264DB95|nr:neuropeptide FF receptor 2-like [Dreissena polymorpha]